MRNTIVVILLIIASLALMGQNVGTNNVFTYTFTDTTDPPIAHMRSECKTSVQLSDSSAVVELYSCLAADDNGYTASNCNARLDWVDSSGAVHNTLNGSTPGQSLVSNIQVPFVAAHITSPPSGTGTLIVGCTQ